MAIVSTTLGSLWSGRDPGFHSDYAVEMWCAALMGVGLWRADIDGRRIFIRTGDVVHNSGLEVERLSAGFCGGYAAPME
ncbi:hypothetical protein T03_7508 [Trichinella britovi]|uniref:Uncharacterized protein n=1 Tax=Trichinella britovi TaxID=45882 RepID=A0A0V1CY97_TRIBR|nr:hypothetical protein T03_7508 [Trichinella britovi]